MNLILHPRTLSASLSLGPRSHQRTLALHARAPQAPLVTAFTTAPTGRVFNSRFSSRFKHA